MQIPDVLLARTRIMIAPTSITLRTLVPVFMSYFLCHMCVLLNNSNGVEVDVLLWLFQRGNDGQASYAPGQAAANVCRAFYKKSAGRSSRAYTAIFHVRQDEACVIPYYLTTVALVGYIEDILALPSGFLG
jgi:hypothetical protein